MKIEVDEVEKLQMMVFNEEPERTSVRSEETIGNLVLEYDSECEWFEMDC